MSRRSSAFCRSWRNWWSKLRVGTKRARWLSCACRPFLTWSTTVWPPLSWPLAPLLALQQYYGSDFKLYCTLYLWPDPLVEIGLKSYKSCSFSGYWIQFFGPNFYTFFTSPAYCFIFRHLKHRLTLFLVSIDWSKRMFFSRVPQNCNTMRTEKVLQLEMLQLGCRYYILSLFAKSRFTFFAREKYFGLIAVF